MTWLYRQTTGEMLHDGTVVGLGYSGIADGLDNPAEQSVPDTGPIPVGSYDIGDAFLHPQCGPVAMRLTPQAGTDTFGRDGFLIHGDNQTMDHTASHGCIILPRVIREAISVSDDKTLIVVSG